MLAFVLSLFLSNLAGGQPAQPKCVAVIDKILDGVNYGSYMSPKPGVSKTPQNNGVYLFSIAGGPKVFVSSNRIDTSSFVFGVTTLTTIQFDDSCNYTSVEGSSSGMMAPGLYAKADPKECPKLKFKAMGSPPMMTMGEQLALVWCGQYFPEKAAVGAPKSTTPSAK